MKTHFFKRGIAGLLSLVMCLSAFIGLGTTTAFAAGEQAEVYLISFPRSGDANLDYSGTWGHSNLHYMNGWYSGESKYTMSNEQVLKNAVYLAEHGKLEEIRTVIVPDQLPNEDTVFQITKLLKPYLDKKQIRYKIIAYRQFGVRSPYNQIFRTPSSGEMMKYKRIAEDNGFENIILI